VLMTVMILVVVVMMMVIVVNPTLTSVCVCLCVLWWLLFREQQARHVDAAVRPLRAQPPGRLQKTQGNKNTRGPPLTAK
jgi:hypothetical protein